MPAASGSIFPQKVIAMIWDFDKTLIPGYMQDPLFRRFGVDAATFWAEVNALPDFYREHGYPLFPKDTGYLSHMLTYVREERFDGLTNAMLREFGRELEFFPGLPDFFPRIKALIEENDRFARHEITVEHYVVSTGLRQTILGSAIEPYVDGVWACEFLGMTARAGFLETPPEREDPQAAVLRDVAYAIDNTTKTRAVFEINKGVNKHPDRITVNDTMAREHRRVPFEHMIYIADGPSDVPVFSIVGQYGGKTLAVYDPEARNERDFRQALGLHEQGRVDVFGPADYREGSHTDRCLSVWVRAIAESIAARWERHLGEQIGKPPEHIVERPASAATTAPQRAAAAVAPAPDAAPGDSGDPRPAVPTDATGNVAPHDRVASPE
jgi:hypothetical protein